MSKINTWVLLGDNRLLEVPHVYMSKREFILWQPYFYNDFSWNLWQNSGVPWSTVWETLIYIICEGNVVDYIIWKTKKFKFVSLSFIVKFRISWSKKRIVQYYSNIKIFWCSFIPNCYYQFVWLCTGCWYVTLKKVCYNRDYEYKFYGCLVQ